MVVAHMCFECGSASSLLVIDGKVKCPACGTVNEVWLDTDNPPLNHRKEADQQ